jgi:hypothetical protein
MLMRVTPSYTNLRKDPAMTSGIHFPFLSCSAYIIQNGVTLQASKKSLSAEIL